MRAMGRLQDKRVLVTRAQEFMGPATVELFREEGAEVVADERDLRPAQASAEAVGDAGELDVLVVNLAGPNRYGTPTVELDDDAFGEAFELMVYPLHRLVRAALPQMTGRGRGKIVVFGSAVPLRGMARLAAYTAARGAQSAYVRSVGVEAARHNVQVNLIAQNWVENPTYYPPELQEHPKFRANLEAQVPIGRLATAREDAAFALFLASDESDFFVGQSIPFSGGWNA